ncbi:MAG: hypothetical protein NUV67_05855 [archaeon]|nr:hypothetical protein [archaeon]
MAKLFEGALRNWKFTFAFTVFAALFVLLQIWYQSTLPNTIELFAIIRGLGFSGATMIAASLFSSIVFRFYPKYAKFWTVRRALGVAGFIAIVLHIYYVVFVGSGGDLVLLFSILNPFQNPLVFGLLGFLIFLPVALTSTDWAMQKLAGKWKAIHRLVYFGFWASIFHFLLLNPPALMNLAGFFLIALTAATLLGELYWFIRVAGMKKYRSIGTLIGLIVILLYLAGFYFAYFA